MPSHGAVAIALTALLLSLVPLALAHGERNGSIMDINAHGVSDTLSQDDGRPRSYWSLSEYATLMYWHIALEILAWTVILPVAVMLSIARSRYTLSSQLAFFAANAIALVLGLLYSKKTPDMYENDSHSKTGWIITCIASAWVFMALIQVYVERAHNNPFEVEAEQPMTAANMARYQRVQTEEHTDPSRWSNDSGQGTERDSTSLYGHSRSPSVESEDQHPIEPRRERTQEDFEPLDHEPEKRTLLCNTFVDRFFSHNVAPFVVGRPWKAMHFMYIVIERTILIQGLVAIANGTVVYGGIGRGGAVFNVLAHYIKGGIFFLYGLLTLGRWMGVFADFGWAWNVKPTTDVVGCWRAAVPSAEFTESFVIWLYGVTNVFLEHLAAWGSAWTAQDLEHVSISIMFFGGGLLGMIIESMKMRELLNSTLMTTETPSRTGVDSWQQPRQYHFSMNPLPALIIMLLGKMMSAHHQDSMLSTMMHSQWGGMFMGFALARGLTYITLYISPPVSFFPSRPPTEIITAFCLISGGITFVLSNKDTVAVLESYGLDAMFTFTMTMGLTALLMAWTAIVVAIKGWALHKESVSQHTKSYAGVLV